nr:TM2 domain-containing protein [uncultured Celeribacter sp.]
MLGTVLAYDENSKRGFISAQNGQRYEFAWSDVSGDLRKIRQGAQVDFVEMEGAKAAQIFPIGSNSSEKSRIVAAILAFFLGSLGVHKFYMGKTTAGIIMLAVFLLGFIFLAIPSLVIGLIAFIEFIIYLIKSDDDFQDQYIFGNKAWF